MTSESQTSDLSSSSEHVTISTLRRLMQLILAFAERSLHDTATTRFDVDDIPSQIDETIFPEVDTKNLYTFFQYIDERVVEDAKKLLQDPQTTIKNRYLKDLKEKDSIAILSAWRGTCKYSSILEDVIEALATGVLAFHHRILIAQTFIVYALESKRASDVVHLVITYLDTTAQSEIQCLVEEYHLLINQNPASVPSQLLDLKKNNGVPTLDLGHLYNALSHDLSYPNNDSHSLVSSSSSSSAAEAVTSFPSNVLGFDEHKTPLQNTTHDLWKQRYFLLKTNFDELDMLRENLIKHNEELQKLLEMKESTNADLKQINTTKLLRQVENDTATLNDVYKLESEILTLRQQLDEALQLKKEMEKSYQGEIQRLKDENQLYLNDSQEVIKLNASVEKYKVYANELAEMKIQYQELQKTNQTYIDRVIDLEEQLKDLNETKHAMNLYKNKLSELEKEKLQLSSINHEQTAKLSSLVAELQQSEEKQKNLANQLIEMEQVYKKNISELQSTFAALPKSDLHWKDNALHESLTRLEKENEMLKSNAQDHSSEELFQMKFQLEDLQRSKDVLQEQYQSLLNKITQDASTKNQQDTLQFNKTPEVGNENKLLLLEARQEALENMNKHLEAQLQNERLKSQLAMETHQKNSESRQNDAIASLTHQLELREKQLNFLTLSRNEELAVHRREEKLMSLVLHHLGCFIFKKESPPAEETTRPVQPDNET